jgi:hypothetical protein
MAVPGHHRKECSATSTISVSSVAWSWQRKTAGCTRAIFPPPPGSAVFKQRWAQFIKKVYEADPLLCPRCGGAMRIIAFIDQREVIEKILTHLRLWPFPSHAPPDSAVA